MKYNVSLNSNDEDDEMHQKIKKNTTVLLLDWLDDDESKIQKSSMDLIIGSELTYSGDLMVITALTKIIDKYLSQDGIFIEILSDDRDVMQHSILKEKGSFCFS
jgi:hypothetical protein